MIYITSHAFEFGIETENSHDGDWTEQAAEAVKAHLDAQPATQVASIHANAKAVQADDEDEFSGAYNDACAAGTLINDYEDFAVTLTAY